MTNFSSMFNDYDRTKTYKTVEGLEAALERLGVRPDPRLLLVQVPKGRNAGRFTVVFPASYDGFAPAHLGFKVLG